VLLLYRINTGTADASVLFSCGEHMNMLRGSAHIVLLLLPSCKTLVLVMPLMRHDDGQVNMASVLLHCCCAAVTQY
jgi:hypothetical protein